MEKVDPFPASDFDEWANSYDEDVLTYERFPFAGYNKVLATVFIEAEARAGMTVLDIGVGTGNLSLLFARAGCRMWGMDYSPAMLEKARHKLPGATLVRHDVRAPWPDDLDRRFERIVSAYTLHHLDLGSKVALLADLSRTRLERGGRLVVADISFRTTSEMLTFAASVGDVWEEEHYWVADEAVDAMGKAGLACSYQQVSACAGVYRIEQA